MTLDLEALHVVGLTAYAARAYAALVRMGPAKAEEVAREAQVPPTKIYTALSELEDAGWVRGDDGRPRIFQPVDPRECLGGAAKRIRDRLDRLQERLVAEYQERTEKYASPFWILHGAEETSRRSVEMLRRAKSHAFMAVAFPLPADAGALPKAVEQATRRDVHVRVMVADADLAAHYKQAGVEVRISPMPFRFLDVDGKQVLIGYQAQTDAGDRITSIWHPDTQVAHLLASAMPRLWQEARPA